MTKMRFYCNILLFLTIAKNFALDWQVGNPNVPRFDRFDGTCGANKNVTIVFNYDTIQVVRDKLFLNGTFIVKQNVVYPPSLNLMIKRCRNKENLNSCENFHAFKTDKYCQLIQSDSQLWNPFFSQITPKWTCPLRKGTYRIEKGELDISAFLLFPSDGWFWKARGEMLDGRSNKLLMCVIVEAKVDKKRKN